jgi:hypothetical protein
MAGFLQSQLLDIEVERGSDIGVTLSKPRLPKRRQLPERLIKEAQQSD